MSKKGRAIKRRWLDGRCRGTYVVRHYGTVRAWEVYRRAILREERLALAPGRLRCFAAVEASN